MLAVWLIKCKHATINKIMLAFINRSCIMFIMNRLPIEKRAQIIGMLVEGMSLRATSRLADVSINTVTKLLVDVGSACSEYQHKTLRNLQCKRIQCDEIWAFVYAKDKNAALEMKADGKAGDVWTWTAIDADSKLIVSWAVGDRTAATAKPFMDDLADRLGRIACNSPRTATRRI